MEVALFVLLLLLILATVALTLAFVRNRQLENENAQLKATLQYWGVALEQAGQERPQVVIDFLANLPDPD